MLVRRSSCALLCATLMIHCVANLTAQTPWKDENGKPFFKVVSLHFEDNVLQAAFDYYSDFALIRTRDDKGLSHLTAIDLKRMKKLSTREMPAGWELNTTSLGKKYACCSCRGKLMLMDLAKCELIAEKAIPIAGRPVVLFDQLVWLEPGVCYRLPTFDPVDQGPLLDLTLDNRAKNLVGYAAPFRLDERQFLVNGVSINDKMVMQNFHGHYAYLDPPKPRRIRLKVSPTKIPNEAQVRAEIGDQDLIASGHMNLDQATSAELEELQGGYIAIVGSELIYVTEVTASDTKRNKPSNSKMAGDWPIPPPLILLSIDGSPTEAISNSATLPNFIQSEWSVNLEPKKRGFTARLDSERAKQMLNTMETMRPIVERFVVLSSLSINEEFEDVLAAYKQKNLNWLAFWAKANKLKFAGVPLEVPCKYKLADNRIFDGSFAIDFPTEDIKRIFLQLKAGAHADEVPTEDVTANLSAFFHREKAQTLQQVPPLEPLPVLDLPKFEMPALRGKIDFQDSFDWNLNLMLVPFQIFTQAWVLLTAIYCLTKTSEQAMEYSLELAIRVLGTSTSASCISAGGSFLLDIAEWPFASDSTVAYILLVCIKAILTTFVFGGTLWVLSGRSLVDSLMLALPTALYPLWLFLPYFVAPIAVLIIWISSDVRYDDPYVPVRSKHESIQSLVNRGRQERLPANILLRLIMLFCLWFPSTFFSCLIFAALEQYLLSAWSLASLFPAFLTGIGFLAQSRLAWQYARFIIVLSIVVKSAYMVLGGFYMALYLNLAEAKPFFYFHCYVVILDLLISIAISSALVERRTLAWFGIFCPNCCEKSKSKDLFYNRAVCPGCACEWN